MEASLVKKVLEAALLAAREPMTPLELRKMFDEELAPDLLRKLLDELREEWAERPVELIQLASGWRFRTRAEFLPYLERLNPEKPPKYSRAMLETLAIIAYRQPVTRPEVEEIRAVDCGAVVKALLERKLIKILGKKEEPGRPILYGTSREFLEFFALKDLASLPTLREFHELSVEHREIVEKQAEPPIAGIVDELTDPTLKARLEAKQAESDQALDELEQALAKADAVGRAAAAALEPRKEPGDDEPASP